MIKIILLLVLTSQTVVPNLHQASRLHSNGEFSARGINPICLVSRSTGYAPLRCKTPLLKTFSNRLNAHEYAIENINYIAGCDLTFGYEEDFSNLRRKIHIHFNSVPFCFRSTNVLMVQYLPDFIQLKRNECRLCGFVVLVVLVVVAVF